MSEIHRTCCFSLGDSMNYCYRIPESHVFNPPGDKRNEFCSQLFFFFPHKENSRRCLRIVYVAKQNYFGQNKWKELFLGFSGEGYLALEKLKTKCTKAFCYLDSSGGKNWNVRKGTRKKARKWEEGCTILEQLKGKQRVKYIGLSGDTPKDRRTF